MGGGRRRARARRGPARPRLRSAAGGGPRRPRRDGDAAPAAFERARAVAVAHDLPLAELSALHELGTIDMFSTGRRDRLLAARRGAEAAGAVRLAAVLDLQLVAAHHMHGDRGARRGRRPPRLDGATTLGIAPMRVIALALTTCPIALTGDRERARSRDRRHPAGRPRRRPRLAVEHLGHLPGHLLAAARGPRGRGARGSRPPPRSSRARRRSGRRPGGASGCSCGRSTAGDAASAIARLRSCPAAGNRQNLAYAELAEAVLAGRAGDGARAAATVARWDATALPWPWLRHLGRRLVAEAALVDGWGEPDGVAHRGGRVLRTVRRPRRQPGMPAAGRGHSRRSPPTCAGTA